MTQPRRSFARLPRERRVQDILLAARTLFCEHGYENTSMAVIAARAGVVEGTIYKFFATKRELLVQVLAHWYEAMLDDYAAQLAGITGTRGRLRHVVWRHLKSIADEPALCRLFFQEVRSGDDYLTSPLYQLNRTYTDFAKSILLQGVASGELRADLPVHLARDLIYGAIEHLTWRYLATGGSLPVDRLADELADLVLAGARRPAPAGDLDRLAERLDDAARRIETAVQAGGRA